MTSFDEAGTSGTAEPRGDGWRRAAPGAAVRAYVAGGWRDVEVSDVNDVTGEIRVVWPAGGVIGEVASHRILDASLYEPPPGGFGQPPG
ncbi:MAG: hypothetical protein ABR532_01275 [Candidatus Dormibacteria bacterium]